MNEKNIDKTVGRTTDETGGITPETGESAPETGGARQSAGKRRPTAKEKRNKSRKILERVILAALFTALAFGVSFAVHFPVGFLTLDFKDAILAIGGMFLGPIPALLMSAVAALIEFVTISSTGPYGLIMNFISSAAFSVTAALIYKYKKDFAGALIALGAAVLSMTSVMLLANLIVTPRFTGMPVGAVAAMIPTLLLPFNLIKSTLNASIVALLYKPLSLGLSRVFPNAHPRGNGKFDRKSLFLALGAVAVMIAAFIVLFLVFRAKIAFGK